MIKPLRRPVYMATNFFNYFMPDFIYVSVLKLRFAMLSKKKKERAEERVNAYIHLPEGATLDKDLSIAIKDFRFPFGKKKQFSTYFMDLFATLRCFDKNLRFNYEFGDVNYEEELPTIVKSRPLHRDGSPSNSVICKLNKIRHFYFPKDRIPWENKKNMLVSRNFVIGQPHRTLFIETLIENPLCDVGQINPDPEHPEFQKPFIPISEMLHYKFIACIEGNDVATNLKWVMGSNSIAVMPKPKMESWFLEGRLLPGVHYIEVKDDYSDLDEQLQHYIDHPEEAKAIIRNANEYVKQFQDSILEKWIQHRVVEKYLELTNGTNIESPRS